jgi:hypothetical protein
MEKQTSNFHQTMEKLRNALIIVSIGLIASLLYAWHLYDQNQALNNVLDQTQNNIQAANFDINNVKGAIQYFESDEMQYSTDVELDYAYLSANGVLNSMLDKVSQDLISTDTASSSTQN